MEYYSYTYAGLHVVSEFLLSEWDVFATSQFPDEADVLIRVQNYPPETSCLGQQPFVSTDRASFSIPEVGYYKVIEGREIVVTPVLGAGLREVRLYLLGWAWAVLCYQRDLLLLHASAVRVGDGS